jgi:4-alpha-glucanotransferase
MGVQERAAQLGIETSYIDVNGQRRDISEHALHSLLACIPEPSPHVLLPNPLISRGNASFRAQLADETHLPAHWKTETIHGGTIAEGTATAHELALPDVAPGIYLLRVTDTSGQSDVRPFIAAPERAFAGDFDREWLLAVQLYGLQSSRNWGIGDFTDLETLMVWAAQAGAAGIGLNPLHALFDDRASDCSPYSPNSRLFLNPLYIDVTRVAEFPAAFVSEHAADIGKARDAGFVDYPLVAKLKLAALRAAFESFSARTTLKRTTAFEEFRRERGPLLWRFACFEILRRKFTGPWWEWPEKWSSPDDAALNELRNGADAPDVRFIEFVQWCADEQLKSCRKSAADLKMKVGLYLDIAVGVKADGFDAWNEQTAISRRLSVGAPPDPLNTAGQDWGLAGFNATGLQAQSFAPFSDMLAASMRYAGAVRLDHVLGLNRLYLVPSGHGAGEGAYVQMPFASLLAVVAIESARHRCIAIGEDLGTVPEGFREQLSDWGLWSYRVMMFERAHDGSFFSIDYYPQNALVTFNTHDLATFAGWRSAHDIGVKLGMGFDPGEAHDSRAHAVHQLGEALYHAQAGDTDFFGVLNFLSRTRTRLLAVAIEDLLGLVDQPNIPGTIDEHPNWRRRLPQPLETWSQHIDMARLRAALSERHSAV